MKTNHFFGFLVLGSMLFAPSVLSAQSESVGTSLASFRTYFEIPAASVNIKVPTVVDVEVPLSGLSFEYPVFAVVPMLPDGTLGEEILGSYYRKDTRTIKTRISASAANSTFAQLVDDDYRTFAEFPVPEDSIGTTEIILTSERPMSATSLSILLDPGTALPKTIKIKVGEGATEQVVVNTTMMLGTFVTFPKTTASRWSITVTFGQPLRITELRLSDENAKKTMTQGLRFLAQPGTSYRVYFDPDRWLTLATRESGNLADNKEVLMLPAMPREVNYTYAPSDIDSDGVSDQRDNCVHIANTDQADINANGRGDACDDFDRDGVINAKDNCPNEPNAAQADTDSDGIGDACDAEESRVTERYGWIPWVGMGAALLVMVSLVVFSMRRGGQLK